MKKSRKPLIIIALCMIVAGLITCTTVMAYLGFDFTKLDNSVYVENAYEFSDKITDIVMDIDTADVEILPANNGKTKIICYENEDDKHLVTLQNNTLTITNDKKEWYDHIHFGFDFHSPRITLYLPENEYNSFRINGSTGDIKIEDITAYEINIDNSTGDTTLNDVSLINLKIDVSTGDIELNLTICEGAMNLETSTGNISFRNSDAHTITAETSTGNITGTLLTPKTFFTDTSTGDVSVPYTSGNRCDLKTSTGDISITIAE